MMDTSNAELHAVRSRTQTIIESIVGKLFITCKLHVSSQCNIIDDLIKYDFWVVSPKKQVGVIIQELS